MKIDVPDRWRIAAVLPNGEAVDVVLESGKIFRLTRENIGRHSFRVIDGGINKTDAQLERIWEDVAAPAAR